ncbi:MAG: hypothetical protein ACOY71_05975 [Gemmatimonadota bacterium]
MTSPAGSFEFTAEQNEQFRAVAKWMRIVGYAQVVGGALGAIGLLVTRQRGFLVMLVAIVVGIWTLGAARAFRRVADTAGNDIGNVMIAIHDLRKLYQLQGVVFVVAAMLAGLLAVFTLSARPAM